jgi:hypothetical protein
MVDLRLPSLPPEFTGQGFERIRYRLQPDEPYPAKPDWFLQSLGEWVVYWWLSQGRRSRGLPTLRPVAADNPPGPGRNVFFHQIQVTALGLFSLTPTTRIDFYLPNWGGMGYDALVLDPYNETVHGGFGGEDREDGLSLDYAKRQILADQAQIRLIWLHSARLDAGDFDVIEAALAGRDESPRAVLGI